MTEEVEETFVDILLLAAADEGHHQMMVLQLSSLALIFQLSIIITVQYPHYSYLEEVAFQLDQSPLMMVVVQIFVIPWVQLWEAPC